MLKKYDGLLLKSTVTCSVFKQVAKIGELKCLGWAQGFKAQPGWQVVIPAVGGILGVYDAISGGHLDLLLHLSILTSSVRLRQLVDFKSLMICNQQVCVL